MELILLKNIHTNNNRELNLEWDWSFTDGNHFVDEIDRLVNFLESDYVLLYKRKNDSQTAMYHEWKRKQPWHNIFLFMNSALLLLGKMKAICMTSYIGQLVEYMLTVL